MTKTVREMKELISSFQSKSTALNILLSVKLCGSIVLGWVDSGNSFYDAISLSVATKIGLDRYDKYQGPPIGTALVGSTLDIVGRIVNKIGFGLTNESGQRHVINSRLVIVDICLVDSTFLFHSWLKTVWINCIHKEFYNGLLSVFSFHCTGT